MTDAPDSLEARIRRLQRLLYAADADALTELERAAAARELDELEALQRATGVGSARTHPSKNNAAAAIPSAVARTGVSEVDGRITAHSHSERPHRPWIAVGFVASILVVGVAIGAVSSQALTGETPTAEPTSALADDAFARFDAPQTAADVPKISPPASLVEGSFRHLVTAGLDTLYLARDRSHQVCLVVVIETRRFAATCAPESELTADGLKLLWSSETPYSDRADESKAVNFIFIWHPNGDREMLADE